MEKQTNTTEFDIADYNCYDEERHFTTITGCFIIVLLVLLAAAFSGGFYLAKNKYTKPVDHIQTTEINLT